MTSATGAPAWENWSGSQRHRARVVVPRSVDEVARLVREAAESGVTLRCVGSGHSFVPFWIDGCLVSLDGMAGVTAAPGGNGLAQVAAGTKLHQLGPALWRHGWSLPQQGDIDRQSLAGAVATGTHGTGRSLPNLSAYVRAMELVDGTGERRTLTAEADPEALAAARVSFGTFGVVVGLTLALVPAFHLHERIWQCDVDTCAAALPELIAGNRHFEFFWTPRTDRCEMKTLNATDAPAGRLGECEYVAPAYQTFPSERDLRFNEMEYSVPFEAGWACFTEVRAALRREFPKLPWPLEFRTLAADDAMLSTASHRESVTLSVHQGAERDWRPVFDAVEPIFRHYQGRPHWGKLHTLGAAELRGLYPEFPRFGELRRRFDPAGVFLNEHLHHLLG